MLLMIEMYCLAGLPNTSKNYITGRVSNASPDFKQKKHHPQGVMLEDKHISTFRWWVRPGREYRIITISSSAYTHHEQSLPYRTAPLHLY